jgi:hypothetical protein
VDARDDRATPVPADLICRLAGHNVLYPTPAEGKLPGPRLTSQFRPDPFVEVPQACEVVFSYGTRPVARACYRDGELHDGACPDGTFPPPARTTSQPIELGRASLEVRDRAVVITALFTVHEAPPPAHRLAGTVRCGAHRGEGDLPFVPLDRAAPGTSVFGPLAVFLAETPPADAECELALVARPTAGAAVDRVFATYCLTSGAVRVGTCRGR